MATARIKANLLNI